MPLSEHEQRLLEQMERALYAEDPKFATNLRREKGVGLNRTRLIVGVLVGLAGVGLLLTGVAVKLAVIGVVGFIVMLAGVGWALTGPKSGKSGATTNSGQKKTSATSASKGGFMNRLEDRWRQRQEGQGQ